MPLVSHRCPILHIKSMLPTFSHHFLHALVRRKSILSRPFLNYLDFACWSFSVQLLVHAHLVRLSSSTLSSVVEYLVLVDGGFLNALLPVDSSPSTSDHLSWNRDLESIDFLETSSH